MMVQAGFVSMVITCLAVIFAVVLLSGCTGTVIPTPDETIVTIVVNEFGPNPTRYVTTEAFAYPTFNAENTLYGRLTMNGTTPPGYVYQVTPSKYNISQIDEPIDAIGLLTVFTTYANYTSIGTSNKYAGTSDGTRYGLVDPQGNFQINNLTSGPMTFFRYTSFEPPGGNYSEYSIYRNGSFVYYPAARVSHCDLDLTDVNYVGWFSDGVYRYYVTGTMKNMSA